jgi:hypothetical protein
MRSDLLSECPYNYDQTNLLIPVLSRTYYYVEFYVP